MADPRTPILREARRLIAEVGWTQHEFARDAGGNLVRYASPKAACFCAIGAARRALATLGAPGASGRPGVVAPLRKQARARGYRCVVEFNDDPTTTKDEVLELFDDAIASLEQTK